MPDDNSERIHPFLPTRDEVRSDPRLFYSDHVPQLLTLPTDEQPVPASLTLPSGKQRKEIKILTYNVYDPKTPCGYDLESIYTEDDEYRKAREIAEQHPRPKSLSDTDIKAQRTIMWNRREELTRQYHAMRRKRIAISIAITAKQNDLDIILLQEATPQQDNEIYKALGKGWQRFTDDASKTGLICYHRKDKLNLMKAESVTLEPEEKIIKLEFQHGSDDKPFTVINLSGNPEKEHADKSQLLEQLTVPSQLTIIAGDFNTQMEEVIAPIHITTLVPPEFNREKISTTQGIPDIQKCEVFGSTDGGVFIPPGGSMCMLPRKAVDPATGKPKVDINVPLDSRTISPKFCFTQPMATPISEQIKKKAIDKLNVRIMQIERTHGILLRKDKIGTQNKVSALRALIKAIDSAKPQDNLKQIIEQWENSRPKNSTNYYRAIIHEHRFGREEHKSLTKTEKLIDELKNSYKP